MLNYKQNSDKIGVLTFHNALNYGAVLQTYALCHTIESLSLRPEVIDYDNKEITNAYRLIDVTTLYGFIKSVILLKYNVSRKRSFPRFIDEYLGNNKYTSKNFNSIEYLYDAIVVGSDQVWNPELTGWDNNYVLADLKHVKKISYAASIGPEINENKFKQYYDNLNKFSDLSVRESSSVDYFKKMNIRVERVIDPTFLMSKSEWSQLANYNYVNKIIKNTGHNYLLLYIQGKSKELYESAVQYANEHGLKIVAVHNYLRNFKGCINIRDASIEDFLGLIIRANIVYTNSFHGLTISMILNKKFRYYCDYTKYISSRFSTLEQVFNIAKASINNKESFYLDYDYINKIINIEKDNGREYLRKALLEGDNCG